MPIVTVELVVDPDHALEPSLAQSLANAIGHALNSPLGQTWVRLHSLDCFAYAENGGVVDVEELPVFVTVAKRQATPSAELKAEIGLLTQTIAKVVGRPVSSVHIEYAPAAAGRLAFGGKLVE